MKRLTIIILMLTVMLVAGCTQPVARPHIQNSKLFNAPFDETWNAVVEAFTYRSPPIKVIEKESGFISTDWMSLPHASYESKEFNRVALVPNKSFMMIWDVGRFYVNAFVKSKEDNMTEVRINTHMEIFESNVSKRYHAGYSTGFIENDFLRKISTKINQMNQ